VSDAAVKTPAVKETALAVIENAAKNGSLIFFDKDNGFPSIELYKTEVTLLDINKEKDCFKISGKYMPNRSMVDKIGEASGVTFISGDTKIIVVNDEDAGKHPIYVGTAQGKVRLPDGTWRTSSVAHYEFDPTLRAMQDFKISKLTPETRMKRRTKDDGTSYGNTLEEAILEYRKMARQRANTGARLRVIRELVAMPISFTEEQIKKPVLLGRIVQNTSYILNTPEGKMMATAQALGVDMSGIFGGQKMITGTSGHMEGAQSYGADGDDYDGADGEGDTDTTVAEAEKVSDEPDFPEDPAEAAAAKQESEFDRLTQCLIDWQEAYKDVLNVTSGNGKNPLQMIDAELANPDATVETRGGMITRIRTWLEKKGVRV